MYISDGHKLYITVSDQKIIHNICLDLIQVSVLDTHCAEYGFPLDWNNHWGYWKRWECTRLRGLVPGHQCILLAYSPDNICRISLDFDFILIKSKLYCRPFGSLQNF